jgi:hypothetical protein
MIRRIWLTGAAVVACGGVAQAQDVNDLAKRLGSRADVLQISLSPGESRSPMSPRLEADSG